MINNGQSGDGTPNQQQVSLQGVCKYNLRKKTIDKEKHNIEIIKEFDLSNLF